jgi:hypothetical protein
MATSMHAVRIEYALIIHPAKKYAYRSGVEVDDDEAEVYYAQ